MPCLEKNFWRSCSVAGGRSKGRFMDDPLSELKKKAAQLPDSERAELALSLIESLDGPADREVEEA